MSNSPFSPRKYARQERSRRTVERILDAAARIFHERGYSAATTNDIADEADISIGSLYQYFPNKDALLVALTKRHIELTSSELKDILTRLPIETAVDDILRTVVTFLVKQHDLDDLHLLVMHTAPRTKEINDELERSKTQLVDVASLLLKRVDIPVEQRTLTARMIVATIDAAVHDVIIREPRGKKRQAAIDLTLTTALGIIDAATSKYTQTSRDSGQ